MDQVAVVISYRLSRPAWFTIIMRAIILSLLLSAICMALPHPIGTTSYGVIFACFVSLFLVSGLCYFAGRPLVQHPDHVRDVAKAIAWVSACVYAIDGRVL